MAPPTELDIQTRPDEVIRGPKSYMWCCAYCKRPACSMTLKGKRVCKAHGGVTKAQRDPVKRAEARARGETPKRPPGRPVTHGRYSRSRRLSIEQLVAEYQAGQLDADNTDEDMLHLRAHLDALKRRPVPIEELEVMLEAVPTRLDVIICQAFSSPESLTPERLEAISASVREIHTTLRPAMAFLGIVRHAVGAIETRYTQLIRLSKVRAETKLKNHDAHELSVFTTFCEKFLVALEEQLDPVVYAALRKRIEKDLSEVHQRLLVAGAGSVA